jgi:hypothetical protein
MNQPNAKSDPVELLMQESGLEELLEARGASPKDIADVRQKVASRLELIARAAPKEERAQRKLLWGVCRYGLPARSGRWRNVP